MAQDGLDQFVNGPPQKRRAGLMNLFTYGRTVTLTIQTMRSIDPPAFNAWWKPFQEKMSSDPLMAFFNDTRTDIIHEGELTTSTSMVIGPHGPVDIGALMRQINQEAPPNTVSTFLGEGATGGNGWEVRMPDGSIEKVYFDLPESFDIQSNLHLKEPPSEHYGVPITDTSAANLGRIYLGTLTEIVNEFIARFG